MLKYGYKYIFLYSIMKALKQGELDCLCGIYSIVNAVYFVSNKKIKRKPLFNELLLAYMNNWGVYDLLTGGLDHSPNEVFTKSYCKNTQTSKNQVSGRKTEI